MEVADAYATFANEGVQHTPVAIREGRLPERAGRDHEARRAHGPIPAGVAYVVDKILQGNTRYGTAAAIPDYYSGVAAGKTGTTSNSVDAWFCGFNPKLATAVWMGYPQSEIPMPGVQGATYCVPLWGKYYEMVFGGQQVPDFAQPAHMPVVETVEGCLLGRETVVFGSSLPAPAGATPSP